MGSGMRHLVLLVLLGVASLSRAASNFTFSNSEGAHGVGLHLVHQYDYSRAYQGRIDLATGKPPLGERARPIQTLVWYPAQAGGQRLTYGDYVRAAATEEVFERTQAEIDTLTREFVEVRGSDLSPDQLRQELERPMWAMRDAPPAEGTFPVVIYAPSFNASSTENADLCEYLASQGYVVLASPNMGPHSRLMSGDLEGLETQVGDIEFLIGYAHSLPQADLSRLAVVGFSWGGLSNVLTAARDSRVRALVSLDGSVRYFPGLVSEAKYVTPERLDIPFLYVAARPPTPAEQSRKRGKGPTNAFFDALKYSDVYLVTTSNMLHAHFSSANLRFMADSEFTDSSREQVSLAHSWVARYVHHFLDAYLKNDAASMAFLNRPAEQNEVPAQLLSVDARHAVGPPPTQETLSAELARRGFDHAVDVYREFQKQDTRFRLSESALAEWGYLLLHRHEVRSAIEIFKLETTLYPKSGNAFDGLAEAYEKNQDTELALKNYQQCLALNPKNGHARQHLKDLEGKNMAATPDPREAPVAPPPQP